MKSTSIIVPRNPQLTIFLQLHYVSSATLRIVQFWLRAHGRSSGRRFGHLRPLRADTKRDTRGICINFAGEALPQADTSLFNFLDLQGAFAFRFGGSDVSTASIAERLTGQMSVGTSTTLFGPADGTNIGQVAQLTLNLLSQNVGPQRYTFGISSTSLAGGPIILYRVDDDRAFMIESNSTRILNGGLQRQY